MAGKWRLSIGFRYCSKRSVCQAVKNMFTSGGRSYSGSISSLARRNLTAHVNFYMPEFA